MQLNTRLFGEIEIEEEKIIRLYNGTKRPLSVDADIT